jgi:transposase
MKWHRAGVWKRLLESLLAEMQARGLLEWERALVDSAQLRAPGGGRKTGPSPVDRRKRGSKHHLLTDAEGTPLAIELTAANRNDITQLLKLVEAIPPVRGKPGRPRRRPKRLQADRGYDSEPHRRQLKKRRSSR